MARTGSRRAASWHSSRVPVDRSGDRSGAMRRLALLAPAFAIAADVALWVPSGAAATPPAPSIAALPTMVTLPGSLHPRALPQFEAGRMDPGIRLSGMSLLFRMSAQQKALQRYALAAVQDPASPSYHRWLTPEQYASEFGASSGDIARATRWLLSQGLSVDGPSRTATRLAFSGTIAQIETCVPDGDAPVPGGRRDALRDEPCSKRSGGSCGRYPRLARHARLSSKGFVTGSSTAIRASHHGPRRRPRDLPDPCALGLREDLRRGQPVRRSTSRARGRASRSQNRATSMTRTLLPSERHLTCRTIHRYGSSCRTAEAAAVGVGFAEAEIDIEWSGAVAPEATILCRLHGRRS